MSIFTLPLSAEDVIVAGVSAGISYVATTVLMKVGPGHIFDAAEAAAYRLNTLFARSSPLGISAIFIGSMVTLDIMRYAICLIQPSFSSIETVALTPLVPLLFFAGVAVGASSDRAKPSIES